MNRDMLQGKWNQLKGDLKTYFGYLTDNDIALIEGDEDKILGKLQERYGYTREEAQAQWVKFIRKYDEVTHPDPRETEKKAAKERVRH